MSLKTCCDVCGEVVGEDKKVKVYIDLPDGKRYYIAAVRDAQSTCSVYTIVADLCKACLNKIIAEAK